VIDFPTDDEIIAFTERQSLGAEDVVMRDLARLATIFHLADHGFLGEQTVLAGGMALRCYGGHRFTVTDVDTSTAEKVNMKRLDALLNWEIEGQLEVETRGVGWYERGVELEKAKPIHFDPLFSEIELARDARQFELTVNERGLDLDPVEQRFRHDFPWKLGVEDRTLPLMDPREMLAEKIVGYCVGVLGKHYADVAFIALRFRQEMPKEKATLRRLVELKLERGRRAARSERAIERSARFPDLGSLRSALEHPEEHLGVTEFGREVRFVVLADGRGAIPLTKGRQAVTRLVVPWLYE
jgi:hypothetical protein